MFGLQRFNYHFLIPTRGGMGDEISKKYMRLNKGKNIYKE